MRTTALIALIMCWAASGTAFGQSNPAASEAPGVDASRSLFEPTWRQFRLAGRFSRVDGDEARWQRFRDQRNGLLFTEARHAWMLEGGSSLRLAADNVGWRDQRFEAVYTRPGRLRLTGLWDEIPQFYSIDTATPYAFGGSGVLVLDDTTRRAIQSGQANLSAYIPLAAPFDLRERRDIGRGSIVVSPTSSIDLKGEFRTTRHVGELPWGASFGLSNDVEVALPYNSRTNDLSIGAEWIGQRNMLRVGYDGSWFQNHDGTLIWDNPLRLDDAAGAPSRGRMSLWPTNMAHTVSIGGYRKLAHRTQVTGFASYGVWTNDEPLPPFTINTALPALTLPRTTADAEARILSTNLGLVSRPHTDWRLSARVRHYGYDNETRIAIPEFVSYDSSVRSSPTGGPEPFAHSRTTVSADATWSGLAPLALGIGYTANRNGYRFRIFEDSTEHAVRFTADAAGASRATFRAEVELADRSGSGLEEHRLTEIGEQRGLRHFDIANRSRARVTGQMDVVAHEWWVLSGSFGAGRDDYDDSPLGLQDATFTVGGAAVDFQHPGGLGAGGSYNYERYGGVHRSRSASPGAQAEDPLRDWTTDSTERVHYFSFYVTPPRLGQHTEARFTWDISDARARFVYGLMPGSPLAQPSQLPEAYNKLQELRLDVRHRLTTRLAATAMYQYEPFRVFDFALDAGVVDSIVQPSSMVLGYVYRPYTAHSVVVGLLYFW